MKKLLALICAIVLILSVTASAFASSDPDNGTNQEVIDSWEGVDDWDDDDDDWDDDEDWSDDDEEDWSDDDDAAWSDDDDDDGAAKNSPSTIIWWTTDDDDDDDDDDHHHKKTNGDSTDGEKKGAEQNMPVWVPTMDITGYDSMLTKPLEVKQAGALRPEIPALMNRASLDGLILVFTQTDGTVLYAKLSDCKDSFDSGNGAITINFPAAGTCELLALVG